MTNPSQPQPQDAPGPEPAGQVPPSPYPAAGQPIPQAGAPQTAVYDPNYAAGQPVPGQQPQHPYPGGAIPGAQYPHMGQPTPSTPGYPGAYGPGYRPQPSPPGAGLGRVAGGLLLLGTVISIASRFIWGRGWTSYGGDIWVEIPLVVISLTGLVAAILLLIGSRTATRPALGAAAAGMLFASTLSEAVVGPYWFGVVSAIFITTAIDMLIALAAMITAILAATKTGQNATPPSRFGQNAWGQPPAAQPGQWAQPLGHQVPGQPVAPQYHPPQ
ncbi:hypothetical protein ACFVMC_29910 [Nocardia sp. NPDC127579]|uniref:hypothetical protein n=1 Tax=Nocardia sp. NPDC127579 TaxID=3345402 RepID=UPI0036426A78